jgi:hypothetical protein
MARVVPSGGSGSGHSKRRHSSGSSTLRLGSRGSAVKTLQSELGIAADGIFGPSTERAVQSFQSSHGLVADGVVGPATWAALQGGGGHHGGGHRGGGGGSGAKSAPIPSRGRLSYGQLEQLARNAGFPASLAPTMAAIAEAESSGSVGATNFNTNGSEDRGLWQINTVNGYNTHQLLTNPTYNARAAYNIYRQQGLRAWVTYNTGAYRQYMGGRNTAPASAHVGGGGLGSMSAPIPGGGGGGASGQFGPVDFRSQAVVTDADARRYVTEHYPDMAAYLNNPELGPILMKAARGGWGANRLQGALHKTKWWKQHSQAQRSFDNLEKTDPATAKARVGQAKADLESIARQEAIDPGKVNLDKLAHRAAVNNWTSQQMTNFLLAAIGDTSWWKHTTDAQRKFHQLERTDPKEAKEKLNEVGASVNDLLRSLNMDRSALPDVNHLIRLGAELDWTPAQLKDHVLNAVQGSPDWQHNSQAQRKAAAQKRTDPASYKAGVLKSRRSIKAAARKLGVPLDMDQVKQIATDAYDNGWSDDQMQRAITHSFTYSQQANYHGEVGQAEQTYRDDAAKYLVPISDQTIGQWLYGTVTGSRDESSFLTYLKSQAKSLYPWMSDAIGEGITPTQYLDPYRQMAAQTLDVNPSAIDFMNPKWMRLVQKIDPSTGKRSEVGLGDAMNLVRTNPAYGYDHTSGARKQAAGLAESLAQEFGVMG